MPEDNTFNSFRKRFASEPAAAPSTRSPRAAARAPYEPFGTKDKLLRYDLRCEDGLSHMLAYTFLLSVTYDRKRENTIVLSDSRHAVTIRGTNLRPIVDALRLHTCDFVQAFDAEEFEEPVDRSAPFVGSIEVEVARPLPFLQPEKSEQLPKTG